MISPETPTPLWLRKPQRVTITLCWDTAERLHRRADAQGRSFSNLCAYLLNLAVEEGRGDDPEP
jgi:hypothetical protein